MAEKIGVFICECGPNIKDAVEIDELVEFAQGLENVVIARPFRLLCSEEGKELIERDIKEHGLTRVVVAACSPKEHGITFRKVLAKAGLNPFLLEIANIREQCAWVIKDKTLATGKAKAMIRAAVERVVHNEPLEIKEIECLTDVLVAGAGITGISSALTLAQKNRKVYLVERLPVIGGRVAQYEKAFPNLECASCMIEPKLDEVLHNEHIEVLTFSEIQEVLGFYGNFSIKVRRKARFVDQTCIGCGACFEVCPVSVKNEYGAGIDKRKAVYIPYAGALPNVAVIDKEHCLRFLGEECNACRDACPFGSINYEETDRIQDLKVGAIVLATGFDEFDLKTAPQYGHGEIENIYTGIEFEKVLNSSGPTTGKVLLKNGKPPEKIALVHCVGSRSRRYNEYCSGVCCMYLLKFAHMIKEQLPDVSITEFHSDFCLPGKEYQSFFNKIADKKEINFIQSGNLDSIKINKIEDGILIKYEDIDGASKTAFFDMVVLSAAMEGSKDSRNIAALFDISCDRSGFFVEEHARLAPVSTTTEGIFIAGCAQGPKDIPSSVAEGQAAAGNILSRLIPGEKLKIEPIFAEVDKDICSGCKVCIGLCPYHAITYNENDKRADINELLCRGCGICAAACPSAAIKARHFTDEQILSELHGLLK